MIATHAVPMTTAAGQPSSLDRGCFYQRYYPPPLIDPHISTARSEQAWLAWQFDRLKHSQGFLQAIRLPAAPQVRFTFHPQGIDPAAYCFEHAETGETQTISGQDLHWDGSSVMLPAHSGAIWFYQSTNR